jgi:cell division transport system ATP-binding protein
MKCLVTEIYTRGTTVLVATHDFDLIRRMGKRVLTLERGRLRDKVPTSRTEAPALVREAPFLPLG